MTAELRLLEFKVTQKVSVSTFSSVEKKNPTPLQRLSLSLLNLNQDALSTVSSLLCKVFPLVAIQYTESLSSSPMEQRREVFFWYWALPLTRSAFFIAHLISEVFGLLLF